MQIILNPPNLISLTRFLMMPVLLWLAWHGYAKTFLILLASCFFSDLLDGWIARKFHMQTEFGSKLDSWSDFFIYSTMAVGGWWLWPDIMLREKINMMILVACFVTPALLGFIKFRRLTSYHTWSVKLAALLTGISGMWLFAGGPTWPFHLAVPFCVMAAAEQVLITVFCKEPHSNTPTLWHALRGNSRLENTDR